VILRKRWLANCLFFAVLQSKAHSLTSDIIWIIKFISSFQKIFSSLLIFKKEVSVLLSSNNSLELLIISLEIISVSVTVSVSFCLLSFVFICFHQKAFAFFVFSLVGLPHLFHASLLFSTIS
jgi:hypothetical protein